MKHYWFLAFLFTGCFLSGADYNLVSTYGGLTYNLLAEYIKNNPGYNAYAVRTYLNTKAFDVVMTDAHNMGYSRRRVLKATYAIAIQADPVIPSIVEALNAEMRQYLMWKDVMWWVDVVTLPFCTIISLAQIAAVLHRFRSRRRNPLGY